MMSISSSRTVARHNPIQIYYPLSIVRRVGPVLFRDQLPRDIGCLRDVDDDVAAWSCQSLPLTEPDFVVKRADVSFAIDGLRDDAPLPVRPVEKRQGSFALRTARSRIVGSHPIARGSG